MPRNDQVVRFFALIRAMESPKGLSVPSLAEELSVDRRTIYRDIRAIEEAGHPVYQDDSGSRRVWRLQEGYRTNLRDLPITHREIVALWYALSIAGRYAPSAFGPELGNILKKIEALGGNGNGFRIAASRLFRPLVKGAKQNELALEALAVITSAILEERIVEVRYRAFRTGDIRHFRIHPSHLYEYRNGMYVSCYSESHAKAISLAIERMENVRLTEDRSTRQHDLSPEKLHANSIGLGFGKPVRVRLHFDKVVAPYIRERNWHPTQKIKNFADGGLLLSMSVATDPELLSFIASYEPHVVVESPVSLRQWARERLKATLEAYI